MHIFIFALCQEDNSSSSSWKEESRQEWTSLDSEKAQNYVTSTYLPPSKESASSTSYNNYIYSKQSSQDILFTKEVYPQTEFFKNEDIIIKALIINDKKYYIDDMIFLDDIPCTLNKSSIKIEKISKLSNITCYTIKIVNDTIVKDADYPFDNTTILGNIYGSKLTVKCPRINSLDQLYITYNITTNKTREYISNPSKLFFSNTIDGSTTLQSNPVYFKVENRKPKITDIEAKPNPAKKGDKEIKLKAVFEDLDNYDLEKCQLLSSIDGQLCETDIKMTNLTSYMYEYKNDMDNLSDGEHVITFKVYDREGDYAEESITLTVEEYYLDLFPKKYNWTLLIAIFLIIVEILVKDMKGNFRLHTTYALIILGIILFAFGNYYPKGESVAIIGIFSTAAGLMLSVKKYIVIER